MTACGTQALEALKDRSDALCIFSDYLANMHRFRLITGRSPRECRRMGGEASWWTALAQVCRLPRCVVFGQRSLAVELCCGVVIVLLLGDEIARLYKEPTNVTYLALSVFEGLLKLNQPVTCLCYERHQRQI
jgi:hypothetical protein